MKRLTLLGLIVLTLGVFARPQPPARAAFPGANGKIAFRRGPGGSTDLYVVNADGTGLSQLTNTESRVESNPAWSPDGSRLAFLVIGQPWIYFVNPDGSDEQTSSFGRNEAASLAWSPNGAAVAFSGQSFDGTGGVNTDIFVGSLKSGDVVNLTLSGSYEYMPAWSPDGSKIAFARFQGGNPEIYAMNADGSDQQILTTNPAFDSEPDWSPDGSKIAFSSNRDGNFDIYEMNADGSWVTNLTNTSSDEFGPSWSPDGLEIAFASNRDGNPSIYIMASDGSDPRRVTESDTQDLTPDWQPLLAGDVNCAGGVNSIDAVLILQFDAGLLHSVACRDLADVNHDGRLDSRDAALILQYSAGLIDSFPA